MSHLLRVQKLSPNAITPTKYNSKAAGFDLASAYSYTLESHGKVLIKTDLSIAVPLGTYGRIAPRSGLAWNYFLTVGAGVIDSDYRGNVCIVLYNHSNSPFYISPGDKVAQLICEKIEYPKLVIVDSLDKTCRNEKGFGSSEN